jgi:hypothetical protein
LCELTEIKRKNLGEADLLSDPRRVGQFVERTGVDLVVPNLGTEHRTASATAWDAQISAVFQFPLFGGCSTRRRPQMPNAGPRKG